MKAEQVKEWRLRVGLSREKMSRVVGVSMSAWRSWETGQRPVPLWLPLVCEAIDSKIERKEPLIPARLVFLADNE